MAKDYAAISKKIVENIGGVENIASVTHCMTRLRFVVKDEGKINDAAVKAPDSIEGMSTLTKDKQSLEAMYRKGWQDAEKLVQWYRAAKAEA